MHRRHPLPYLGQVDKAKRINLCIEYLDQDGSIIHTNAVNDIGFTTVALPEGVSLQQFVTTDEEGDLPSDSSWWIYAIILLLLGVAAIAYYYL